MGKLVRFSISVDQSTLKQFDKKIINDNIPNRSRAITELINKYLIEKRAISGENIAGVIGLVYDHHKRLLVQKLTTIQHDFHDIIISSQHIHLTHNTCFEIIIVKGKGKKIEELFRRIKQIKGILNSYLTIAL